MTTSSTLVGLLLTLGAAGCATGRPVPGATTDVEEIHVFRSIRELAASDPSACTADRVGFAPFPRDADRLFSFWGVRTDARGTVLDAHDAPVASLRGCFGPTEDPARQNFEARITIGDLEMTGRGECLALQIDAPEKGLYPVRCHLLLADLPPPYVGGLLTTNTVTSPAAFGGESDPPGYTQASIATIRLWKARPATEVPRR